MANRSYWRLLILGLLVGLTVLVLLLSQVNLSQVRAALARLDGRLMLVPLLIALSSQFLRPCRWQAIFPPETRPGFWSCFGVLAVGNMANNFLPGRGGDLLRCFLIRREHSLAGASLVLATLGLEKVLDGLALLTLVLFSIFFLSPPQWLGQLVLFAGLIFASALVVLLLLQYRSAWFLSSIQSLSQTVHLAALGEKMAVLFVQFAEGLSAVGSSWQMVRLTLLTILVWLGEAAITWGLALALNISLSFPAAATVSAILNLGLMIPAAPGFIGTYEFFSVAALRLFGTGLESALALTLVMHSWALLATSTRGIIGLGIIGISFSHLIGGQMWVRPPWK